MKHLTLKLFGVVLTKFHFSRVAGQLWNFFEKFGTKDFNEVFPVLTGQGNNLRCRMPPEYNDKLRLLFRLGIALLTFKPSPSSDSVVPSGSVENVEHYFQWVVCDIHGKSTVNPDVHEMYDLSMGCYHHLCNALQAFLPVVQDSNDHTLNGGQTECKHTAV